MPPETGQTRTFFAASRTDSSVMAAAGAVSSSAAAVGAGFCSADGFLAGSSALVAMDIVSCRSAFFSAMAPDTNSQPETPTAHTHSARTM